MEEKYILIELCLFAEGAYSGATYEEVIFITPQDYIKYFGSGQDTEAETFEKYIEEEWKNASISVGELDGKHSEVFGDVEVDFWDANRIAEYWEQTSNDGERLADELAYMALGNDFNYTDRKDFLDEINSHVKDLVESIGTKVTIECRVPKDKVKELEAFVEKLNKK